MALTHVAVVRFYYPLPYAYQFKKFSSRRRYGKPLAMVNGSNSASKYTIETPHGESEPIGCSAGYIMERYPSGLRERSTKSPGQVIGAWVRIPLSPPYADVAKLAYAYDSKSYYIKCGFKSHRRYHLWVGMPSSEGSGL